MENITIISILATRVGGDKNTEIKYLYTEISILATLAGGDGT